MTGGTADLQALAQRLDALERRHHRLQGVGALVLVGGLPDDDFLTVFRSLVPDFTRTIVMTVTESPEEGMLMYGRAGAVTVTVDPDESWSPAWRTAMELSWYTASAG